MAFPLLVFLGGAAVGAAAALAIKEWMDRTSEGGVTRVTVPLDGSCKPLEGVAVVSFGDASEAASPAGGSPDRA